MIVTAQAKRECPQDVKKFCSDNGMKHFWIELNGANQALLANPVTLKYLRKRVRELMEILTTTPQVCLIHCAAGIHRTGSLGFTLLRLGSRGAMSKEEAYLALKTLREDTHRGVGDWRIDIADKYLVLPVLANAQEDPTIPDDCPGGDSVEAQEQAALEIEDVVPEQEEVAVEEEK